MCCQAIFSATGRVLIFDDNGGHPGMQAAEMLIEKGAEVEIVTPERFFAPEIGGLNHVAYAKALHQSASRITINTRLIGVSRSGNELCATRLGLRRPRGEP